MFELTFSDRDSHQPGSHLPSWIAKLFRFQTNYFYSSYEKRFEFNVSFSFWDLDFLSSVITSKYL